MIKRIFICFVCLVVTLFTVGATAKGYNWGVGKQPGGLVDDRNELDVSCLYDEYVLFDSISGKLTKAKLRTRLRHFVKSLGAEKRAVGYVHLYPALQDGLPATSEKERFIRDFFRREAKPPLEVRILVGGRRSSGVIDLYLVPVDADPPGLNPERENVGFWR